MSPEDAQAAIRRAYAAVFRSPREPYRLYQERLGRFNCMFAAEVHNATTAEQRRRAVARVRAWEEDLRALAEGAPSPAGGRGPG